MSIDLSTPQRQQDILKLCEAVLQMPPERYYNPNGSDESTCPMCFKKVYNCSSDISDIDHSKDCGYLIAKDLSTGLL